MTGGCGDADNGCWNISNISFNSCPQVVFGSLKFGL